MVNSTSPEAIADRSFQVLAVGRFDVKPTPEQVESIMPHEVPKTMELYLDGKIAHWFARRDRGGAVFVMNVASVEEARQLLEALPLGVAGLMKFDLIPLGPLKPMRFLVDPNLQWHQLLQR